MKKVFPIQLDVEIHRQMKHASVDAGETLHEWVLKAIEERLAGAHRTNEKDNSQRKAERATKTKKN